MTVFGKANYIVVDAKGKIVEALIASSAAEAFKVMTQKGTLYIKCGGQG